MSMKSEWFSDIAFTLDLICKFSRIDICNDNGRGLPHAMKRAWVATQQSNPDDAKEKHGRAKRGPKKYHESNFASSTLGVVTNISPHYC